MKVIIFRKILVALLIGYSSLTIGMFFLDEYSFNTSILMGLSAIGCLVSAIGQIKLLYNKEYRDKIV